MGGGAAARDGGAAEAGVVGVTIGTGPVGSFPRRSWAFGRGRFSSQLPPAAGAGAAGGGAIPITAVAASGGGGSPTGSGDGTGVSAGVPGGWGAGPPPAGPGRGMRNRNAASRAAPSATTPFGSSRVITRAPNRSVTSWPTRGTREDPPTRKMAARSSTFMPASRMVSSIRSTVRSTSSMIIASNWLRLTTMSRSATGTNTWVEVYDERASLARRACTRRSRAARFHLRSSLVIIWSQSSSSTSARHWPK